MIPNGPGCAPRTGATLAGSQLAGPVRRLGADLHFGPAEQRVARGQRDGARLARQRADPHRAEPTVLAERERVVADQHRPARQGERDLAPARTALVAVGVAGA